MISNLAYLGIYEDAINSAIDTCEEALKSLDFSVDDIDNMNEWAVDDLKQIGSWDDITNSIISAYFSTTACMINERYPDKECDYYVNCDDSHFYIDNEEVY